MNHEGHEEHEEEGGEKKRALERLLGKEGVALISMLEGGQRFAGRFNTEDKERLMKKARRAADYYARRPHFPLMFNTELPLPGCGISSFGDDEISLDWDPNQWWSPTTILDYIDQREKELGFPLLLLPDGAKGWAVTNVCEPITESRAGEQD